MEDPFYSFSPDTKLPWVSSSSEMYAPMTEMDFKSSPEGAGGLSIRQFTGTISSTGKAEPTETAYQAALIATYTGQGEEVVPLVGDYITLLETGTNRLVARFWILDEDNADANATISFTFNLIDYFALNVTYTPIEQLTAALANPGSGDQPNGADIEPDPIEDFAISVNDFYSTNASGFLVPATGNPTIAVNGGTFQATDDISATATGISTTSYGFPTGDAIKIITIYLEVTLTLNGPGKTISAASATITSREGGTSGVGAIGETSFPTATTAKKTFTIGVVGLAKREKRRFARIAQFINGTVSAYSDGTGSNTPDSNGVNKAAGPREITLVINGQYLYTTKIVTGPLIEVT
jgi:hypothetical protein